MPDADSRVRGFCRIHSPVCSRFDICWRYADVLNNFTICLTLLFLPSGNSWRVMVAFAGFCFLIWALDRYILLYCSVQTPYATPVPEVPLAGSVLICSSVSPPTRHALAAPILSEPVLAVPVLLNST